eukprot:gb/GFBE01013815.1/.p1 GENE.gb/GFBE01013815.1/~~gb/GFBE01013815.1/.p1  ORF type:complete len:518 (+),score=123.80 gb/GFBE01013815.1/:1-1554(+)
MTTLEASSTSLLQGQPNSTYGTASSGSVEPPPLPQTATPAPHISLLVAECFGTFMLVFIVGCAVASPAPAAWAATAIASTLMVMVYATGPVCGGNLNPAVSLALAISHKLPVKHMFYYWLAQILGGLAGAGLSAFVVAPKVAKIQVVKPFDVHHAVIAELIYTFMLCFVVLSCAASRKNNPPKDPNQFYGLAIGFVIVAGGYAVGGISGAALNPAVALGLGATSGNMTPPLIWTGAEIAAAVVAAGVFRLLRSEEFQTPELSDSEIAEFKPGLPKRCFAELLGTFMLVLTVGLNLVTSSPSTAFSAAAALMCMVYSLGNISGAHLNPAVTVAVLASGRDKCQPVDGLCYILSQLLGGVLAALLTSMFHMASMTKDKSIKVAPSAKYTVVQAGIAEFMATLVLAYVVLTVATVRIPKTWKTKQNFPFGLAIGSCVTAGGFAIGAISGGELNPAVTLAIAVENMVYPGKGGTAPLNFCLAFMAAEVLGGLAASGLMRVTHPEEFEEPPEAREAKVAGQV